MTTETQAVSRPTKVFVVLNAGSGGCDPAAARRAIAEHLDVAGVGHAVHEPAHGDSLREHIEKAVADGCDLIVAAGGDGTVSGVADALTGADVAMGIVPLGTANVLAGELGVPMELEAACRLLAGPHRVTRIDMMEVGGRHYATQVGVGLDALMIRDTAGASKRRFGRAAYLWTAAVRLIGVQPSGFTLTVDGVTERRHASQVLVANSGTLGLRPFRWGPDIRPDDGTLDVCIIRVKTLLDFAALGWHVVTGRHDRSPHARYRTARTAVTITTKKPMPVQADGEIIGETPVTVRLVPAAVRVAVPLTA